MTTIAFVLIFLSSRAEPKGPHLGGLLFASVRNPGW
jgi:hypothetical protein